VVGIPDVRYAKTAGGVHIAYQVVGAGPIDLVYVPSFLSHLQVMWEEPIVVRFLQRLASFSRLVLFEKRGTGLSDPLPVDALPTLEERSEDLLAVLDAVGSKSAALFGSSEGGPQCLLFAATHPERIVLGTHAGLYESADGGRTWQKGPLGGNDAMNLVRTPSGRIWAAGHNVLFASDGGGRTWAEVRPEGLPGLDLHGFAADPDDGERLYAAVAGEGLYRSVDGGRTFSLVSEEVGPNVFGLSVTSTGRILAADPSSGVYASDDGGRTWALVLNEQVDSIADVDPHAMAFHTRQHRHQRHFDFVKKFH